MKKVININFQGRIIPIEESAYEVLQKYSESLRRHFANEEGRDEIINDIETRISELFGESLKNGAACITDDEVNAVINSMGRPEDFDMDGESLIAEPVVPTNIIDSSNSNNNTSSNSTSNNAQNTSSGKRLYRDENHKILGGVCSGIANYFNIDPVVVRILALIFFGAVFIPYIVVWIVVPSSATKAIGSPRKRLFRDTDNKKIAGVCAGLAHYFGVNTWIPRVLFLIPFISIAFRINHWSGWGFPHIFSLSFSPAATVTYIILWILVPEAKSTSDKLEMQGKPVDLNSIKDTVQNDLSEFKDRAQKWSKDVGGTAKKWSDDVSNAVQNLGKKNDSNSTSYTENVPTPTDDSNYNNQQNFSSSTPRTERSSGVPIILKIIGYIILGLIITPVILSLFGIGIGFMAVLPATDFVLKSGWETILSWGTFFLFIWVPIIGIILWFFRLITRSRKGSSAIRGAFIGLWILGWICFFGLFSIVGRDFSRSAYTATNTFDYKDKGLKTMVVTSYPKDEYNDVDIHSFSEFLEYFSNDSVKIPNVMLRIEASKDNNYHVESVAYSSGASKEEAINLASKIVYSFEQKDSVLYLPTGFYINRTDKFRNQRVQVKIYVPIGKQIIVKGNNIRHNVDINIGPSGIHRSNWDNSDNYWDNDILYVMTAEGLKPVNQEKEENNSNKESSEKKQTNKEEPKQDAGNSDEEKTQDVKENKSDTKTTATKKFVFYNMASLLSDKFSL
ncbi:MULTISPECIES: PspC domain-containing protein [Chitinophagaceae]